MDALNAGQAMTATRVMAKCGNFMWRFLTLLVVVNSVAFTAWYRFAAKSDFPYQADGSVELYELWVLAACVIVVAALTVLWQRYGRGILANVAVTVTAVLAMLMFSGYGHYLKMRIYTSNRRADILAKKYGDKIDLCRVLKVGMPKSQVGEIMGSTGWGFRDYERYGKIYHSTMFEPGIGSMGSQYRTVFFDERQEHVVEVECFDGTWIKAPGADPLTVYTYRTD